MAEINWEDRFNANFHEEIGEGWSADIKEFIEQLLQEKEKEVKDKIADYFKGDKLGAVSGDEWAHGYNQALEDFLTYLSEH